MSKKNKGSSVPPTLQHSEVEQDIEPGLLAAPIEIQFHVAGANVQKYDTPQGLLTILSLISPIGIALTVKLSEENVDELVKDLKGEQSSVDVYTALPPGFQP